MKAAEAKLLRAHLKGVLKAFDPRDQALIDELIAIVKIQHLALEEIYTPEELGQEMESLSQAMNSSQLAARN